MSIRTIIEINHDYLHDLEQNPRRWETLIAVLKSGGINTGLNAGETPAIVPGIRALGQRHHSYKMKLEVK